MREGGCACGSVRYRLCEEPLIAHACHCRDCQRSSGAPFASGVVVLVADTEITGTPQTHPVRASSGSLATRSFCPDCGAPLFTHSEAAPGYMSIRFSTLDALCRALECQPGDLLEWTRDEESG